MESKQNYFIVFDTIEGAYLCLNEEGNSLLTYSTEKEAREYFELHYQECHELGLTWSTSATLHWATLKPFIVSINAELSPADVVDTLSAQAPDSTVFSLSSIAVRSIKGLKVDLWTCRQYEVSQVSLIQEQEQEAPVA
ncbi:hypothetical protein DSM106972_027250 [Dulcicalothrix desertica PCC 7102]|uniref:Uncharacterized protein n=1 Tax=Dulcicalothrix desertica PCC 7102 TaxID=232991 RepID=A0A433VK13_9CYAN|nr:hypothetical protein [Dulcicalothrix desertica]RUT06468.1 hypothetical protein DSM106972_027250 [Dulcicalothrix desertica PCC 7102]TWH62642.1 hypothetical protein CAL7102_00141 [Dulcicalothrix desertica PCC 7102]